MNNFNSDLMLRRLGSGNALQNVGNNTAKNTKPVANADGKSFEQVLNEKSITGTQGEIKLSKHAFSRLESRNIELTDEEVGKMYDAFEKAKSKGINDALILMSDKAFIANIKSGTIVTATLGKDLKDSTFTKIDGAVIV